VYGKQWVNWGGHYVELDGERAITKGINQIQNVIDRLKTNPDCRRLIVSTWNVPEIPKMALAPCHVLFQFITEPLTLDERFKWFEENKKEGQSLLFKIDEDGAEESVNIDLQKKLDELSVPKFRLSLQLYQRSMDTFLGASFNTSSYSLLLLMVAQVSNMVPYKFVHTTGDAHLYLNHKEQVNELLYRTHNSKEKQKIDYWNEIVSGTNPDDILGTYYGTKLPSIKLNPKITNIFDFTIDDIDLIDYNPLPAIKAPVAV
jgi:thymidylate synthase